MSLTCVIREAYVPLAGPNRPLKPRDGNVTAPSPPVTIIRPRLAPERPRCVPGRPGKARSRVLALL